jgi:hypothetical protein
VHDRKITASPAEKLLFLEIQAKRKNGEACGRRKAIFAHTMKAPPTFSALIREKGKTPMLDMNAKFIYAGKNVNKIFVMILNHLTSQFAFQNENFFCVDFHTLQEFSEC